jgi:hypothetical protein
MAKSKTKERVYLSEEEKTILAGLLEEWNRQPGKKSRDSFVSAEALPKIQQLNLSKFGPDIISKDREAKITWERRVQVRFSSKVLVPSVLYIFKAVFTWFKNNKPYKDRAVFKLERKIPVRRVIGKLKADEIDELVATVAPDVQKGDKQYPGHFQKALTDLKNSMSAEEMEEMEKIRDEWQNVGPPIDIRLK